MLRCELNSKANWWRRGARNLLMALALPLLLGTGQAWGQSCQAGEELEGATKTGFEAAALQYFGLAAKGDVAGLRSSAIPVWQRVSQASRKPFRKTKLR